MPINQFGEWVNIDFHREKMEQARTMQASVQDPVRGDPIATQRQRERDEAAIAQVLLRSWGQPGMLDAAGRPQGIPASMNDDGIAGAVQAILTAKGRKPADDDEWHAWMKEAHPTAPTDHLIGMTFHYQTAHGKLKSKSDFDPDPATMAPVPEDTPTQKNKVQNLQRVARPEPKDRTKGMKARQTLEGREDPQALARQIHANLDRVYAGQRRVRP